MDHDRKKDLVTALLVSLLGILPVMILVWWSETPDWKRQMVLDQLKHRKVMIADPIIENAVRDFSIEFSRWEHARARNNS